MTLKIMVAVLGFILCHPIANAKRPEVGTNNQLGFSKEFMNSLEQEQRVYLEEKLKIIANILVQRRTNEDSQDSELFEFYDMDEIEMSASNRPPTNSNTDLEL